MESPRTERDLAEENERTDDKEGEKDGWCGRLVGRQEEVCETETRPADRTSFSRETDRSTFHAPAKPVEKLFFLAFDNHWITSDAEPGHDRPMRVQFAREPVSPGRHSGNSVNLGDGGPDESAFRACQQSSS